MTWALGHLVQPALPEGYGFKGFSRDSLPVIPEEFMLIPRQVKTDKGYKADAAAVKQIKVITKLWRLRTRRGTDIQIPVCLYGLYASLPPPVDKLAYGYRHPQGIEGTEGRA